MAGFILDSAVTLSALLLVAVALVEGAPRSRGGWVGLVIYKKKYISHIYIYFPREGDVSVLMDG